LIYLNGKIDVSFIWMEEAEGTYDVQVGIFLARVLHMPDDGF
jgi:hypothetical protein